MTEDYDEKGEDDGRKTHVIAFLKKCIEYADASIERKNKRGETEDIPMEAYRDYTAHALMEVEAGELDRWFPAQQEQLGQSESQTIDLESLSHEMRSQWLTLTSPRPLPSSLHHRRRRCNIAPYTSMSVVSNSPPLVMVLSADRNDRWRDTLLNLRQTKEAVLNFLPISNRLASIVEQATQPIDSSKSEWEEFELDNSGNNWCSTTMHSQFLVKEIDLPEAKEIAYCV